MADETWTRMAANILPAVVGGLAGARRGGMGALPGALYGLGSGARYDIETGTERERITREAADRERVRSLAERRQSHEEERFAAEKDRWAIADRNTEAETRYRMVQLAEIERKATEAKSNRAAFEEMLKDVPPELQPAARANPDAFLKDWRTQQMEAPKRESLGRVLKNYRAITGLPDAEVDELAKSGDLEQMTRLVSDLARVRSNPRAGSFKVEQLGKQYYLLDQKTGALTSTNITGEAKDTFEQAHKLEQEARQQISAALPKDQLGNVILGPEWGKTIQERTQKFEAQVNRRKRELAAERGLPELYRSDPLKGLAQGMQDGSITSSTAAVTYLLSQGVPENQAKQMARKVIAETHGTEARAGREY